MKRALLLLVAAGLGACGSDDPELVAANAWLQHFKVEHRDEAERFAQECVEESGLPITRDGMLEMVACMKDRSGR